jgi:hypothetical protein
MTLADIERKGFRIGRLQWVVPKRCWALSLFYAFLYTRVPLVALMKVVDSMYGPMHFIGLDKRNGFSRDGMDTDVHLR